MEIEITESRPRKVSRRLDDNHDNEHLILGIEEKFRATFFYEVLDIISEFESRFNQESRQYLTVLGDLRNRKVADNSKLARFASDFSLDFVALKHE